MATKEELEIGVKVTGAGQAQKALKTLDKAAESVAETTKRQNATLDSNRGGLLRVSDAQKKAGLAMANNVNLATEMGLAFGGLNPQLRMFTMNMAGAGNNAFQLGNALGPIGVGISLLMGAVPALISLFSDLGDEAEDAAISVEKTADSLSEFIQRFEESREARSQAQRFAMGVETEAEAGGRVQQAREQMAEANNALARSLRSVNAGNEQFQALVESSADTTAEARRELERMVVLEELQIDLNEEGRESIEEIARALVRYRQTVDGVSTAEERLASAREDRIAGETEEALVEGEEERRRNRPKRKDNTAQVDALEAAFFGDAEAMAERRAEMEMWADPLGTLEALMVEAAAGGSKLNQTLAQLAQEGAADRTESIRELAAEEQKLAEAREITRRQEHERMEELRDAEEEWAEISVGSIDSVHDAWVRLRVAQGETAEGLKADAELMRVTTKSVANDIVESVGQDMKGAFETSMDAILDGTKSGAEAFEEFAKNIIKSLVKRSIVEVVVNAAEAIAAAARYDYAAAAQHAAAAGMWAAVGGVAAGVGFGTGLLGGGSPSPDPNSGVSNLPEDDSQQEQGGGTTVINVGTFPVSTDAEIGRAIQSALDAREREGL